jgi:hypothetical protein
MPIIHTKSGKWKYGKSGHEYSDREDALTQMRAIKASESRRGDKRKRGI